MKKFLPVVILVVIAAAFVIIGLVSRGRTGGELQIAVIPKGTTHVFWQSIHQGALPLRGMSARL